MQLVNIAIMQTLQLNGFKDYIDQDDIIEAHGGVGDKLIDYYTKRLKELQK